MYRRSGSRSRSGSTRRTSRSGMASRSRGSLRAAYQARDSALFTVRSETDLISLSHNGLHTLCRTFVDPQFSAISSLYD